MCVLFIFVILIHVHAVFVMGCGAELFSFAVLCMLLSYTLQSMYYISQHIIILYFAEYVLYLSAHYYPILWRVCIISLSTLLSFTLQSIYCISRNWHCWVFELYAKDENNFKCSTVHGRLLWITMHSKYTDKNIHL